jgi:hypothetical protein
VKEKDKLQEREKKLWISFLLARKKNNEFLRRLIKSEGRIYNLEKELEKEKGWWDKWARDINEGKGKEIIKWNGWAYENKKTELRFFFEPISNSSMNCKVRVWCSPSYPNQPGLISFLLRNLVCEYYKNLLNE